MSITWVAIITFWIPIDGGPINRVIDKEFTSEVACWNYYEGDYGENRFGTQNLTHQGVPPGKGFHFSYNHLEYPIRTYNGKDGSGPIWLTCDIKERYKGL
jgi:hypothetical protein